MKNYTNPFFELIQIALGAKEQFSNIPNEKDWEELMRLSREHALLGVTFMALENIPASQRPPRKLLLQWYAYAEQIKRRNHVLNHKVVEVSREICNNGFKNIVLKGQGIAKYYGIDNLDLYRTPGDIDIWLKGSREDIIKYVHKFNPHSKVVYHHVDFPAIDGVEIEIHFTPSWMNNYFTNTKLQQFFASVGGPIFERSENDFNTPTLAFNRVYILVHIYRHLFHEGIGLRQLMDYYYVLRQGFSLNEKSETLEVLRSLGMMRFTGAVMWIMQYVFGLPHKYLLIIPDEKEGRFLLKEIMQSGNFGHYDHCMKHSVQESDFSYGMRKFNRNFRFIYNYPSEVIWSPLFKIWHFFWRKKFND